MEATSTFAMSEPDYLCVEIDETIQGEFNVLPIDTQTLIKDVIAQNPLPPFHQDYERIYGIAIVNLNIRFKRIDNGFVVIEINILMDE